MNDEFLSIDYIKSLSKEIKRDILNRGTLGVQNLTDKEKRVYDTMINNQKNGVRNFNAGGITAPQFTIDPAFYDSPEYKGIQRGMPTLQAFTYSPYFGMASNSGIRAQDEAYRAYAQRVGFDPNTNYIAPNPPESQFTGTGNTSKSGIETADGSPIYTNTGTTNQQSTTDQLVEEITRAQPATPPASAPASAPAPAVEPTTETVTTTVPPEQPAPVGVGADPRNTGVVFDPTAGSNVAAENQQNTQSGTSATTPDSKDNDINLGDLGEAALPVLGLAAVDFLDGDGEIDFGKVLSGGAAIGSALGLDLFDKLGNSGADKIGYQGTIPTYAATRRQVPVDNSTGRRPGSGGRRYFTDMRYTAPSGIAGAQQAAQSDAAALRQMNQANPLNQPVQAMNMGGIAGAASRYLNSSADGMADTIPSSIDNKDPAALSGGEFVVAADVVSGLGNGNSNAGAKQLYDMMDRVRKARTGTTKQGKQIKPNSVMPV